MEPPMPQVHVFYITNEVERNQNMTRTNKIKKSSTLTNKIEPQVHVCYITNEVERNQNMTRTNKIKKSSTLTNKIGPPVPQVLVC
jgi:hypothetical protein